jgi:hypothetical protein
MNEKGKNVLSLILALIALVIPTSPFTLTLLRRAGLFSKEFQQQIYFSPFYLILWGWLMGLVIGISSIVMVRRSDDLHVKTAVWVLSSLGIIIDLIWATLLLYLYEYCQHGSG